MGILKKLVYKWKQPFARSSVLLEAQENNPDLMTLLSSLPLVPGLLRVQ